MIAPSAHRNRHLRSLCELGVLTAQRRRSENFSVENFCENHLRNAQETHKFDRKTAKDALQNHFPSPTSVTFACSCSKTLSPSEASQFCYRDFLCALL